MPREMTRSLHSALDSLDGGQRRAALAVLSRSGLSDPTLAKLMRGLVAELRAADAREADALAALEADHRAELDEVARRVHGEQPEATGPAWWPLGDAPEVG